MRDSQLLSFAALAAVSLAGIGGAARGAVVPVFAPSDPVISDTQVLNAGTTALAYDLSGATGPVNGVTFSNSATQNGITLSGNSNFNNASNTPSSGTISTAFANVIASSRYNDNNQPATLTLSGLTNGATYTLQVFAGTGYTGYNGPGGTGNETINATGPLTFGGTVINGVSTSTFIADGTGQATLTFAEAAGSNAPPIFNAISLRAVPEPASLSLLGLGGIGLLARRRRA